MSRQTEVWSIVAKDLNLDIIAPFILNLSSGKQIKVELLIKNFGAPKGMIIVDKYEKIEEAHEEILKQGYGFSVIREPRDNETYQRDDYIELLIDWGWSSSPESEPDWYKSRAPAVEARLEEEENS